MRTDLVVLPSKAGYKRYKPTLRSHENCCTAWDAPYG